MAGLLGAFGLVRYRVEGELPESPLAYLEEKIREHAFREIDDTFEEKSTGLVSLVDMLDCEFKAAPPVLGDYIIFSIRVDQRKVPPATLKKFCQKEEEKRKKSAQVPKLSRAQRVEIKESIQLMLLKKAVPEPKVYNVVWDLNAGAVFFFNTSGKAQELLESFFLNVLKIHVIREIPAITAARMAGMEDPAALCDLTPAIFS